MATIYIRGNNDAWKLSLSAAGVLDFESSCPADEAPSGLVLHETITPDPTLEPARNWWTAWGRIPLPPAEVWKTANEKVVLSSATLSFLTGAPALKAAIDHADSLALSDVVDRCRTGQGAHAPLLKYLVAPHAAAAILSGGWGTWNEAPQLVPPGSPGASVHPLLEALDFSPLKAIAVELRPSHLLTSVLAGTGLTLPVVGLSYADWTREVGAPAFDAYRRTQRDHYFDPEKRQALDQRVEAWVESLKVVVQPEPWNRHDTNALKVVISDGQGVPYKAGYLRRSLAALLAPWVAEPTALRAELVRFSPGGGENQESLVLRVRSR
ncbi:MAG: HIRAN domain-containing protein [Spirochaetales bacterium]